MESVKQDVKHERNLSIGEALDMGTGFAMHGNHASAIQCFRGVLIHEPENFEALNRIGASLFETQQYYEALYRFERALKINRRHVFALGNYGLTLSQLGHADEGLPYLERAVAIAEKAEISPAAKAINYNNLGNTLERLGQHAEALPYLDKGIACDPLDPFPHYNRGICLLRLNRHAEGVASMDRALVLHTDIAREGTSSRLNIADTLYNRAMGHLLLGHIKEGFADYEARLLTSENDTPNLGLPADKKWKVGDSIEGKRLLVHCEQGLGDTIHFLRFLASLKPLLPLEILVIAHKEVRPLLPPNVTVVQPGDVVTDAYDCWVALMSLPIYLGIEREDQIPRPFSFPVAIDDVETWAGRLPIASHNLRVGICWSGSFQHKNDMHRSIPLAKFASLFDVPADFVSLHHIRPNEEEEFVALKKKHPNLGALYLEDFRSTAAVMINLDLVVTVDTSVAHMAATLGVPTWILIPKFGTDWRWQIERSDSPWYPTAELFRQDRVGDWTSTIARIKDRLKAKASVKLAA